MIIWQIINIHKTRLITSSALARYCCKKQRKKEEKSIHGKLKLKTYDMIESIVSDSIWSYTIVN